MWLTPTRSMLRHMNILSASMFRNAGDKVNFRAGTGNVEAEIDYDDVSSDGDYSGVNLPENSSIAWDDSNVGQNSPLWIPEIYTFSYPLSYTDYKNIRTNLYKMVRFDDGGSKKYGFILDLVYSIQTKQAEFTLLRAAIGI